MIGGGDFGVSVAILFLALRVTSSLKDVALHIEPQVVQNGSETVLRCDYDLEGAQLYSLKFYRGRHEFYRYTPKELPRMKVFPVEGIALILAESNDKQVVLRNVSFILTGVFSCEVTSENAPVVSTMTVSEKMWVVVFPTSLPRVTTEKPTYSPGDVLIAKCTAAASRPAAELSFILNNILVCTSCNTTKIPTSELYRSEATLKVPLFDSHFLTGRLILKCVATVNSYQLEDEVVFYSDHDPVPERVTFNRSSGSRVCNQQYLSLVALITTLFFL